MILVLVLSVLAVAVVAILLLRYLLTHPLGCRSVVGISFTNKIVFVTRVDNCVVKKYLVKGWKPMEVGGVSLLQERSREVTHD